MKWMRQPFLALALVCTLAAAESPALRLRELRDTFLEPGQEAVITWRVVGSNLLSGANYPCTLYDYPGRPYTNADLHVSPEGVARVRLLLPPGFYEIEIPSQNYRGGLICLPAPRVTPDPFFGMHTALMMKAYRDPWRAQAPALLSRLGVGIVRELSLLGAVRPTPEQQDWEVEGRDFETTRRALRGAGLEILDYFHDTPAWAQPYSAPVGESTWAFSYPAQLSTVLPAWQAMINRWGSLWTAWELWNEPDLMREPIDRYTATVKAGAWALAHSSFKPTLVGGIFSTPFPEEKYFDLCARNGLFDFAGALSFHIYHYAEVLEPAMARYRAWLQSQGRGNLPIWITESGRSWPMGRGRPTLEADKNTALDITLKAVEARACGAARYMPFILLPFGDAKFAAEFGMMGNDGTALRSLGAYAQVIRALAGRTYIGDLQPRPAGFGFARIFSGQGGDPGALLVLGSGCAPSNAPWKIPVGLGVRAAYGLDGRPLSFANGSVSLEDGLAYLYLTGDSALGPNWLQTNTRARRLRDLATDFSPGIPPAPSGIVLQTFLPDRKVQPQVDGYAVELGDAPQVNIGIRINNLGTAPEKLRLQVSGPGSWTAAWGGDETLQVPPGFSDQILRMGFVSNIRMLQRQSFSVKVRRDAGSTALDTLCFDLRLRDLPLMTYRQEARRSHVVPLTCLPVGDFSLAGNSGKSQCRLTAEGHWRQNLMLNSNASVKWHFPNIQDRPAFPCAGFDKLVIRARCLAGGRVGFSAKEDVAKTYTPLTFPLKDDWCWHTATVNLGSLRGAGGMELDWSKVTKVLALGLSAGGGEASVEVSDLLLVAED